jgi:hypothetical protein
MPGAIAIRIYCVNLFDIFAPVISQPLAKFGRFRGGRNTHCKTIERHFTDVPAAQRLPKCSRCETPVRPLASGAAHKVCM